MASPEGETANSGAEACLLEVQLKALVGLMQATIDKALVGLMQATIDKALVGLMQATIDKALKDRGRGSDSPVGCG